MTGKASLKVCIWAKMHTKGNLALPVDVAVRQLLCDVSGVSVVVHDSFILSDSSSKLVLVTVQQLVPLWSPILRLVHSFTLCWWQWPEREIFSSTFYDPSLSALAVFYANWPKHDNTKFKSNKRFLVGQFLVCTCFLLKFNIQRREFLTPDWLWILCW